MIKFLFGSEDAVFNTLFFGALILLGALHITHKVIEKRLERARAKLNAALTERARIDAQNDQIRADNEMDLACHRVQWNCECQTHMAAMNHLVLILKRQNERP